MFRIASLALAVSLAMPIASAQAAVIWLSDYFESTRLGFSISGGGLVTFFDQIPTTAGRFVRYTRVSCRFLMSTANPPTEVTLTASSTATGAAFRTYYVATPPAITGASLYIVNEEVNFLISTGTFPQVRVTAAPGASVNSSDCILTGVPVP